MTQPLRGRFGSPFAALGYENGELMAIDLDGESDLSGEWKDRRGWTVVVTSHEDALTTWHTTFKTGDRNWDRNVSEATHVSQPRVDGTEQAGAASQSSSHEEGGR